MGVSISKDGISIGFGSSTPTPVQQPIAVETTPLSAPVVYPVPPASYTVTYPATNTSTHTVMQPESVCADTTPTTLQSEPKPDCPSAVAIYILQLQQGKIYVGKTRSTENRIQAHFEGNGCAWTRKYPPLSVLEVVEGCDDYDEDKHTKRYMAKYGVENVRGGTYCTVELDEATVSALTKEIRAAMDLCLRCGRGSHFVEACYANTDIDGKPLYKKGNKVEYPKQCKRCGRTSHTSSICYARTNTKGEYI